VRTVVDGSVATKWYFAEPGHAGADRILAEGIAGEREILAPDLLVPEFVNVLWKRVRRRECSRHAAAEILALFAVDCPALLASSALAARAFELAIALGHPAYDCFYLALAVEHEASLATADRALARAAAAVLDRVELVA
jgi:predicted nucleic acid-binding protein